MRENRITFCYSIQLSIIHSTKWSFSFNSSGCVIEYFVEECRAKAKIQGYNYTVSYTQLAGEDYSTQGMVVGVTIS